LNEVKKLLRKLVAKTDKEWVRIQKGQ
jgi:hypothetical protein